jgi:hypothetical protein
LPKTVSQLTNGSVFRMHGTPSRQVLIIKCGQ